MGTVYSPSATLSGYQLKTYNVTASIDSILQKIEYSFYRKALFTTVVQSFADAAFETAAQQVAVGFEFQIHREFAPYTEVEALANFVNQQFGSAAPFHFTAPDDGQVYTVRFQSDQI